MKVCKICGKEFESNRQKQICCSQSCTRQHNRILTLERARKPRIKKFCANCGKEFETARADQINCSAKCSKKYYNARRQRNNHFPKVRKIKTTAPSKPKTPKPANFKLTKAQKLQCERLKKELLLRRKLRELENLSDDLWSNNYDGTGFFETITKNKM